MRCLGVALRLLLTLMIPSGGEWVFALCFCIFSLSFVGRGELVRRGSFQGLW